VCWAHAGLAQRVVLGDESLKKVMALKLWKHRYTNQETIVKFRLVISAIMLFSSVCVQAGTASSVIVTHIEANAQGQFLIYVSSTISNSPSCAALPATAFIVDGSTNAGKVVVSVAEAAFALGKTVIISGDNTCSVHSGYETFSDIETL